jgi:hypothetical protein
MFFLQQNRKTIYGSLFRAKKGKTKGNFEIEKMAEQEHLFPGKNTISFKFYLVELKN